MMIVFMLLVFIQNVFSFSGNGLLSFPYKQVRLLRPSLTKYEKSVSMMHRRPPLTLNLFTTTSDDNTLDVDPIEDEFMYEVDDAEESAFKEEMENEDTPIVSSGSVGGRIVISGLSSSQGSDELALLMLNNQRIWNKVTIVTNSDPFLVKKRLISRSARYSGLSSILSIEQLSPHVQDVAQWKNFLVGANAWVAYNVSQVDILPWCDIALASNVSRVIFTTQLTEDQYINNQVELMDFALARKRFMERDGFYFTGIRHGKIVKGEEDLFYYISNSSTKCIEPTVPNGVLLKLVTELINIDASFNEECGVSGSGNDVVRQYIKGLRSLGLTRQEEIYKMFTGGFDRALRRIIDSMQDQIEEPRVSDDYAENGMMDEEEELVRRLDPYFIFETKGEEIIANRTNEILADVWANFQSRMLTLRTSERSFFMKNHAKARALAEKEFEIIKSERLARKNSEDSTVQRYFQRIRSQYRNLLKLERNELIGNRNEARDWLCFITMVLRLTLNMCNNEMDHFLALSINHQQELVTKAISNLRPAANKGQSTIPWNIQEVRDIVNNFDDYIGMMAASTLLSNLDKEYSEILSLSPPLQHFRRIVEECRQILKIKIPSVASITEMKKSDLHELAVKMKS